MSTINLLKTKMSFSAKIDSLQDNSFSIQIKHTAYRARLFNIDCALVYFE